MARPGVGADECPGIRMRTSIRRSVDHHEVVLPPGSAGASSRRVQRVLDRDPASEPVFAGQYRVVRLER
jgi:hypothetical protein